MFGKTMKFILLIFLLKNRYIRRKRSARCFNEDIHFDRTISEFCECHEDDFECAIGSYK